MITRSGDFAHPRDGCPGITTREWVAALLFASLVERPAFNPYRDSGRKEADAAVNLTDVLIAQLNKGGQS